MSGQPQKRINDEFKIEDVGSSLLNELAKGLYTAEAVLREYIQNAVDAHRQWEGETGSRVELPIQVELRPNGISILDSGIGMNEMEARNVKAVAVSPKRNQQEQIELTGHKGVGIWAGLSFFEKLTLQTSRKGEAKGYKIEIHFKRILESISEKTHIGAALNPNYEIYELAEDLESHYTDITLTNPTKDSEWFLNPEKVADALRRIVPCQIDPNFVFHNEVVEWQQKNRFETFIVELNGDPVYRDYSSAVEDFTHETLTINDISVAEVWYAISKRKMLKPNAGQLVGFRIIQSGFVIGDTNPYSARKLSGFGELSVGEYPNWYVGEIYIVNPELRPNLPRTDFEDSELQRKFVQKLREWYDERDVYCRVLSQKRECLERYRSDDTYIQSLLLAGAPLFPLTNTDRTRLSEIDAYLRKDEITAKEDKRGRAPKSTAHIDGRRDRDVSKLRKSMLAKLGDLFVGEAVSSDIVTSSDENIRFPLEYPISEIVDDNAKPNIASRSEKRKTDFEPPSTTQKSYGGDIGQSITDVFLSLLEEVLREKLPSDSNLQEDILTTFQRRLAIMTDYE